VDPRVRMPAPRGEPTGSPFGASSPEVRATTGECLGLKIPVSGVQFSPCPPFLFGSYTSPMEPSPSRLCPNFARARPGCRDWDDDSRCLGLLRVECRQFRPSFLEHRFIGYRIPGVDRLSSSLPATTLVVSSPSASSRQEGLGRGTAIFCRPDSGSWAATDDTCPLPLLSASCLAGRVTSRPAPPCRSLPVRQSLPGGEWRPDTLLRTR
jgi:hypothetical protein